MHFWHVGACTSWQVTMLALLATVTPQNCFSRLESVQVLRSDGSDNGKSRVTHDF